MKYFTMSNVRDFMLKELAVNWFGEIFDEEKGVYRYATEEDFKTLKTTKFQVKDLNRQDAGLFDLKVILFGKTFKIAHGKDLSDSWRRFQSQLEKEDDAGVFIK